jgi:hypothetical protein
LSLCGLQLYILRRVTNRVTRNFLAALI